MMEPQKVWIDQCDATANIQNNFGLQPALHYLVGEKFLDFLETAESEDSFEAELPAFVERIKGIFQQDELSAYLVPSGHRLRDARLVERAREWLLEDTCLPDSGSD